MSEQYLYPFEDVVKELSQKYSIPFEIVDSILIDWIRLLYENIRGSYAEN